MKTQMIRTEGLGANHNEGGSKSNRTQEVHLSRQRSFQRGASLALLLVLLVSPSIALAQSPQGPTNPFHTECGVSEHPSEFDEISLLLEVAPSSTPGVAEYGGFLCATVIQGEVTVNEVAHKAASHYTMFAHYPHLVKNLGTTPARLIATVILPKGRQLVDDPRTSTTENVIYQTQREFSKPPARFTIVQDVLEFAPGAVVPLHSHGGDVLGLVIQGQMTNRNGAVATKVSTGEGFVENVNQVHSIGNESDAPAAFFGTILLPPGGEVITIQSAPPSILPTAGASLDSPLHCRSPWSLAFCSSPVACCSAAELRRAERSVQRNLSKDLIAPRGKENQMKPSIHTLFALLTLLVLPLGFALSNNLHAAPGTQPAVAAMHLSEGSNHSGGSYPCTVRTNALVKCERVTAESKLIPAGESVSQASRPPDYGCGVNAHGTIVCWGDNAPGQIVLLGSSLIRLPTIEGNGCSVGANKDSGCPGE